MAESKSQGKKVKCIVVINPGNPTGSILNAETIKKVIEFSVKNKLIIIADEVILIGFRSIAKMCTRKTLLSCPSEKFFRLSAKNTRIIAN